MLLVDPFFLHSFFLISITLGVLLLCVWLIVGRFKVAHARHSHWIFVWKFSHVFNCLLLFNVIIVFFNLESLFNSFEWPMKYKWIHLVQIVNRTHYIRRNKHTILLIFIHILIIRGLKYFRISSFPWILLLSVRTIRWKTQSLYFLVQWALKKGFDLVITFWLILPLWINNIWQFHRSHFLLLIMVTVFNSKFMRNVRLIWGLAFMVTNVGTFRMEILTIFF